MNTTTKLDEHLSSLIDGECSDIQLDEFLAKLRSGDGSGLLAGWHLFHLAGDALRSEELGHTFSEKFSKNIALALESEPNILAPRVKLSQNQSPIGNSPEIDQVRALPQLSRYVAMTSMAAAVIVALVMAPQIIPLFNEPNNGTQMMAANEKTDSFSVNVKLASNTNINPDISPEFAPKLANQVEMLRDPRLDSYLLAHQKVSPTLDNGARYIQKANVVVSSSTEQ